MCAKGGTLACNVCCFAVLCYLWYGRGAGRGGGGVLCSTAVVSTIFVLPRSAPHCSCGAGRNVYCCRKVRKVPNCEGGRRFLFSDCLRFFYSRLYPCALPALYNMKMLPYTFRRFMCPPTPPSPPPPPPPPPILPRPCDPRSTSVPTDYPRIPRGQRIGRCRGGVGYRSGDRPRTPPPTKFPRNLG